MTSKGMLGLLKRHPSLTQEEFSHYWLHTHGPLGMPWALATGCVSYIQIHQLRLSAAAVASPPADLDITEWDGAAELFFDPPAGYEETAKIKDFFQRVIVPDEKKCMFDEARKHAKFVDANLVEGERIVLIKDGKVAVGKDGKPVVDITKATKIWDEWVVKEEEDQGA